MKMGVFGSRVEEDKALQLCRERKRCLKQALNGRCALAAAHAAYIHSLKNTGSALRKFMEPLALPPSPLISSGFQANHMRFGGGASEKVEESFLGEEESESDNDSGEPSPEKLIRTFENGQRVGSETAKEKSKMHSRNEEGIPQLEEDTEKNESFLGEGESQSHNDSGEPSPEKLIGTFENVQRVGSETGKEKSNSHPKDLFSSMKEVEFLFIKASESGTEVPRMLEANKLNFRPILPGKRKKGSMVSSAFWKACFSRGEEPKPVAEEPAQTAIKYLTWHRTAASPSSSSRNLLGDFSNDDTDDDPSHNLNTFTRSSGHASTLDRLHAWERKLYEEVKASEMVRRDYDIKCKALRKLESKAVSSHKIDKTRSVVKDLHSRIRVGVYRIDSISRTIEDLRDKELQPQLEELIAGLSRMWEVAFECHEQQFQIISAAQINAGDVKFPIQSESRREITAHLENELYALSSSFGKWVEAQRLYIEAIDRWLLKCVSLPQKNSKRNRRMPPPSVRNYGPPPIYVTCSVWSENLKAVPAEEVAESVNLLAAETARFLPRQEKRHGGKGGGGREAVAGADQSVEDLVSGFNGFHSSLLVVLSRLIGFAESSSVMYAKLNQAIEDGKRMYYHAC